MRMFAGAIRLDGGPAPTSFRAAVRGAPYCKEQPLNWVTTDGLLAVVGPAHGACPPAIVRSGPVTVVGVARIDNRADMLAWLGDVDRSLSDLALAGEVALRRGVSGVARLLGDFAFVVWEADTRTLIAARDTFGVKQLYYATPSPGVVTFSSRAELLAQGDDYNMEYLAAWISYCGALPGLTVFRGVHALPAASVLRWNRMAPVVSRYWNPFDAQARDQVPMSDDEQCDAFRGLLVDAVRDRLSNAGTTWSHLSGGLDSSSVVSTAQWLVERGTIPRGLSGTITFVDPIDSAANERMYSDAVVDRYQLPNVQIPHQLDRHELLANPPLCDQPQSASYGIAVREGHVAETLKRMAASVLLTGLGGDNLVLGTMFFFADWIATGHIAQAVREMAHRSAVGRVSFWELVWQNAVMPLIPNGIRARLVSRPELTVPDWVSRSLVRRYELRRRTGVQPVYGARRGAAFAHAQASMVESIPLGLADGEVGEVVDIRHPYLHRPLVELTLRLAPEMCVRPYAHKWILREATRGMLPELVRTRVGKSNGGGLTSWSLAHEQRVVEALLRDSILADLGLIDVHRIRSAVGSARRGGHHEESVSARVQLTLDVELWLQVRAGRWASARAMM